jgi:hypothetical protein
LLEIYQPKSITILTLFSPLEKWNILKL